MGLASYVHKEIGGGGGHGVRLGSISDWLQIAAGCLQLAGGALTLSNPDEHVSSGIKYCPCHFWKWPAFKQSPACDVSSVLALVAVGLLQVLQLQQKQRALERQLKQQTAATAAATTTRRRSTSASPTRKAPGSKAAAAAPSKAARGARTLQQPAGAMSGSQGAATSAAAAAAAGGDDATEREGCPDSPLWSDVTHSPDVGSPSSQHSPHATQQQMLHPSAAGTPAACLPAKRRPWPLMQRHGATAAATAHTAGDEAAASWPALCAELGGEVEGLRAALLAREQQVGVIWLAAILNCSYVVLVPF